MAEQKKTNEALNVEDALTQSEAFLIKNKKTINSNDKFMNARVLIGNLRKR